MYANPLPNALYSIGCHHYHHNQEEEEEEESFVCTGLISHCLSVSIDLSCVNSPQPTRLYRYRREMNCQRRRAAALVVLVAVVVVLSDPISARPLLSRLLCCR